MAAKSICTRDVIDVTAQVKGQRIILIISGTTYTPEDSNPRHDNAVYLHEILPRKRSKKSFRDILRSVVCQHTVHRS